MNLTINPISFKARIMFEPKTNTQKDVVQKPVQLKQNHASDWFMKFISKMIKSKLSVKIKHPS